jgi:hypothetical protein
MRKTFESFHFLHRQRKYLAALTGGEGDYSAGAWLLNSGTAIVVTGNRSQRASDEGAKPGAMSSWLEVSKPSHAGGKSF